MYSSMKCGMLMKTSSSSGVMNMVNSTVCGAKTSLHVVLGVQPDLDDHGCAVISKRYTDRIERMVANLCVGDVILFTGGCTKGDTSEARLGHNHARKLSDDVERCRVFLEEQAMTTSDNFRLSWPMLQTFSFQQCFVYCDRAREIKVRGCAKREWKGIQPIFEVCPSDETWLGFLVQVLIATPAALIDPKEKHLARIARWW